MCAKSDVYVTWVRHNIVKPTKGKERLQVRVQCDDSLAMTLMIMKFKFKIQNVMLKTF